MLTYLINTIYINEVWLLEICVGKPYLLHLFILSLHCIISSIQSSFYSTVLEPFIKYTKLNAIECLETRKLYHFNDSSAFYVDSHSHWLLIWISKDYGSQILQSSCHTSSFKSALTVKQSSPYYEEWSCNHIFSWCKLISALLFLFHNTSWRPIT